MSTPLHNGPASGNHFRIQINNANNHLRPQTEHGLDASPLSVRPIQSLEEVKEDLKDNLVIKTDSGQFYSIEADNLALTKSLLPASDSMPAAGATIALFDAHNTPIISGQLVYSQDENDSQTINTQIQRSREMLQKAREKSTPKDEEYLQIDEKYKNVHPDDMIQRSREMLQKAREKSTPKDEEYLQIDEKYKNVRPDDMIQRSREMLQKAREKSIPKDEEYLQIDEKYKNVRPDDMIQRSQEMLQKARERSTPKPTD